MAEEYLKVISSLGVDVSPLKTHRSKHFFEFAKRVFYFNEEITAFPISSLKETIRSPSSLADLLMEQANRGWVFSSISSSAKMLQGMVFNIPSRLSKVYEKRVKISEGVLSLVRGLQNGSTFLNEMVSTLQLPLRQLTLKECQSILSNLAVELFSDSTLNTYFIDSEKEKLPLYDVIVSYQNEWNLMIDSHPGNIDDVYLAHYYYFYMTPLYMAFMAIMREYDELINKARMIDSTGSD